MSFCWCAGPAQRVVLVFPSVQEVLAGRKQCKQIFLSPLFHSPCFFKDVANSRVLDLSTPIASVADADGKPSGRASC